MKHTNMYYKLISSVFAMLCLVSLFSCKLNAEAENNQGITQPVEKAILTGPCGETADTSDDIVEINGNRYYTLTTKYEKDYYFDEDKGNEPYIDTEENKALFHKIRVQYWKEWLEATDWHPDMSTLKISFKNEQMTWGSATTDVVYQEDNKSYVKNLSGGKSFYIVAKERLVWWHNDLCLPY